MTPILVRWNGGRLQETKGGGTTPGGKLTRREAKRGELKSGNIISGMGLAGAHISHALMYKYKHRLTNALTLSYVHIKK